MIRTFDVRGDFMKPSRLERFVIGVGSNHTCSWQDIMGRNDTPYRTDTRFGLTKSKRIKSFVIRWEEALIMRQVWYQGEEPPCGILAGALPDR